MVSLRLSSGHQADGITFQVIEISLDGVATPDVLSQLHLPAGIDTRMGVVVNYPAPTAKRYGAGFQ